MKKTWSILLLLLLTLYCCDFFYPQSNIEEKTYNVTYHGNGKSSGTVPVDNTIYIAHDSFIFQDKGDLEKERCTFLGWSLNTDPDEDDYANPPGKSYYIYPAHDSDYDLYAVWTEEHYTVSFNFNYDYSPVETVQLRSDDYFYISYEWSDKESYLVEEHGNNVYYLKINDSIENGEMIITDWNTSPDGTGESYPSDDNGNNVHPPRYFTGNQDITLYAIWEESSKDLNIKTRRDYGVPTIITDLFPSEDIFAYVFSGGNDENVIIPDKYHGYKIVYISGMYNNDNMETIRLPKDLKYIAFGAFQYTNLHALSLPDGLVYIGQQAFIFTHHLRSVTIPASVSYIGSGVFYNTPEEIHGLYHSRGAQYVTVLNPTPPEILNGDFDLFSESTQLYVPDESLELYKEADTWSDFAFETHSISEHP